MRVVSRSAPPRPWWNRLYLALIAVSGAGTAAHVLVRRPVLVHVMDAGFALLLFGALAGWVRFNRTALTRLDEPGAGAGRPSIRIVRSRPLGPGTAPMNDGTARFDPDERVVIPDDFR